MTEVFRGGVTSDLAVEFRERIKYKKFLQRTEEETGHSFLDSLYEKSLYGFINPNYEVIAPTPSTKTFGEYSPNAEGLDFVVNQFNKFRNEYIQKASSADLQIPSLISDLIPRVSYVNYESDYSIYSERVKNMLIDSALSADPRGTILLNFENFLRFFHSEIFQTRFLNMPFTKTGFLLSNESSVYNTGLYIDLGQGQSVSLDQAKVDFIRDSGFLCFFELTNKFGFYIDANYPWRIIVNLDATYTQNLLSNGRPTPQSRFHDFYSDIFTNKPAYDDYASIQSLFESAFYKYSLLTETNITQVNISSRVLIETWLETLLLIKFKELSLQQSYERTPLFKETLEKVLDTYAVYGVGSNSGVFGKINTFCAEQLKNKILGQP